MSSRENNQAQPIGRDGAPFAPGSESPGGKPANDANSLRVQISTSATENGAAHAAQDLPPVPKSLTANEQQERSGQTLAEQNPPANAENNSNTLNSNASTDQQAAMAPKSDIFVFGAMSDNEGPQEATAASSHVQHPKRSKRLLAKGLQSLPKSSVTNEQQTAVENTSTNVSAPNVAEAKTEKLPSWHDDYTVKRTFQTDDGIEAFVVKDANGKEFVVRALEAPAIQTILQRVARKAAADDTFAGFVFLSDSFSFCSKHSSNISIRLIKRSQPFPVSARRPRRQCTPESPREDQGFEPKILGQALPHGRRHNVPRDRERRYAHVFGRSHESRSSCAY